MFRRVRRVVAEAIVVCSTALIGLALAESRAALANSSARAIVQAVEARYRRAATLKAVFYEHYSDGKGAGLSESGSVYFAKPGRMRWEYDSPQQKLFIVDGKNVWFYVPADHAASRAKMKESSDWRTPIALLAGKADLNKICRRIELVERPASEVTASSTARPAWAEDHAENPLSPQDSVLRCTPRESSDEFGQPIRDVLLETDPEAHLVRVVVQQPGNAETQFRFGNWQENLAIPESKFHFQPPPGVAIVDEQSLAGQIY
jgi:outer membrane lipoprotein carrier protein